jgi:hypothetical protein
LTLTRLLQLGLRINVTPNQEVLQCHLMESPSGSSLGGLFLPSLPSRNSIVRAAT